MTQLMLSPDQVRVVTGTSESIQVCSPQGEVLGIIAPRIDPAEVAEAKRRLTSSGKWYTTEQVLEHLHSLETR